MKIFFCITLMWILADGQFSETCGFDDRELTNIPRSFVDTAPAYTWKYGHIPYNYNGNVIPGDKALIRRAMDQIEKHTCFSFRERNSNPNKHHLEITVKNPSCQNGFSAYVTAKKSINVMHMVSLRKLTDSRYCNKEGGVLHELMHVLGVMHTQKRLDRNKTIIINDHNINQTFRSQYEICYGCKSFGVPYDCDSIMHYGTETLKASYAQGPTMTAINPYSCRLTPRGAAFETGRASNTDWDLLKILGNKVCEQDCKCVNPFGGPFLDKDDPGHPGSELNCGSRFKSSGDCFVDCNSGCTDTRDTRNDGADWCRSKLACAIHHRIIEAGTMPSRRGK